MKKWIALVIAFTMTLSVKADEGMWLLSLLQQFNIVKMQKMGLKLSADQIYSLNHASLKDAVVGLGNAEREFGFSCSSELISPDGLLLTNHHCGFEDIQSHSSVKNNYVDDGFWAMKREDELPNQGKTATFFIRMEDVTDKVLAKMTEKMSEAERETAFKKVSKTIVEDAIKGTGYKATVKDFFKSNKYYLLVYETFLDVRLVGTPPSSIGKFGGDTDNWMWPRHTGDFSIFRIYTAPDGKPAAYSKDNVPLKSKHFFPISLKGVDKGDFAMIMGYPGTTERYESSWGVNQIIDETNTARVKVRTKKLAVLKDAMSESPELYIKYTSKYSTSSNYWKYSIGQNKGLRRLKTVDRKQELEKRLSDWIQADPVRKIKYGEALPLIERSIVAGKPVVHAQQYLYEALLEGPEIIMFAYNLWPYYQALAYGMGVDEAATNLKKESDKFFKDYDANTDKKLMSELFKVYADNVDADKRPSIFKSIDESYGGDYEKFADEFYSKSIMVDQKRLSEFIEKPDMQKVWSASSLIAFTDNATNLYALLKYASTKTDAVEATKLNLKKAAVDFFADFKKDSTENKEKVKLIEALKDVIQNVERSKRPDIFEVIEKEYKGDVEKFVAAIFKKSIFENEKTLNKFLDKPKLEVLENDLAFKMMRSLKPMLKIEILKDDMAFRTMMSVIQMYFELDGKSTEKDLSKGERLFMAALMEMENDKTFYPDANSTMRLTYGTVGDYTAADAVFYKHYTTLTGIMEKENPEDDEFKVPAKLKELYQKKDFGRYAKDGDVRVCFTTNNDITGGNSGSPVLNGNGELIGIAFDGNWEAMSGDIAYEKDLQKTICVDIRYVLFVIDKFAGASNLIQEMKIIEK